MSLTDVTVEESVVEVIEVGQQGPAGPAGPAGTTDHTALTNRDAADQHPISAVTGLQTALDAKEGAQTAASQVEAEAGTEAAIRSWSPVRIWQALAAWGAKTTSVFKGKLTGVVETSLSITSEISDGAHALDGATVPNLVTADLVLASNAVTVSNRVTNKPIVFRVYHSGVAAALTIDSVDVGLGGAAGDLESFVVEFDGVSWLISPPVVLGVGAPV